MAVLYLVSTPIGNLGDMTFRAVETLRAADLVLAEDTRRTGVLLRHFGIEKRAISAHEHNERSRAESVVEWLRQGKDVALVSDAGTPLVSDPGERIVERVLEAGFSVVPIPGASALLAALVGSGLATDRFTFYAFLPRKGGDRTDLLAEIAALRQTAILYEAPNRLAALLRDLATHAGPERRVVVARELTKLHEEFFRGTLAAAADFYQTHEPRGEVVVLVSGAERVEAAPDPGAAEELARALLADGMSAKDVARELRERLGLPRNQAYGLAQGLSAS